MTADRPDLVDQEVLDDLRRRLGATRRIPRTQVTDWSRGTDPDHLRELLAYWADGYDWRAHEARILALPWVRFGDGWALHRRADRDDAPAVVLLHGWPDSFLRFERVLPLLTDLHVVVPCLPGFPLGPGVPQPGMASRAAMADAVAELLDDLGHPRYVVAGGDIGSGVAQALAVAHPDRVAALHLTDVPLSQLLATARAELTDAERNHLAEARRWQLQEGAYLLEQSTRPDTLAVGLGDSPAGLASWLLEKLRGWSDCGGDVERTFPRDDLLTWITLYWVTGAIGTSFSAYYERPRQVVDRVDVPTAVTLFAHDLLRAPREYAERWFDVRSWVEEPDGGHFTAWEQPERFAAGLRRAVDLLPRVEPFNRRGSAPGRR